MKKAKVCYKLVMSIGWVIFCKTIIVWLWGEYQDWRKARKDRSLGQLFYEEWRRRSAKHPLALPDLRAERRD